MGEETIRWVVVSSDDEGPSARLPAVEEIAARRHAVRVRTLREALDRAPDIVIVTETPKLEEEYELLGRSRSGELSSVFVCEDPGRTSHLIRGGAGEVVTPAMPYDELESRLERVLFYRLRKKETRLRCEELEVMAYTDALTGLWNRRFLDQEMSRETARANRYGRPISLVLFDIDDFKLVNDCFGHGMGDCVLRHMSDVLRRNTRRCDCTARLGGDEFATVLGDIDQTGAPIYAARVLEEFSSYPELSNAGEVRLSLSVGIASAGPGKTSPTQLMREADRALYLAKHGGGGRIEISDA